MSHCLAAMDGENQGGAPRPRQNVGIGIPTAPRPRQN